MAVSTKSHEIAWFSERSEDVLPFPKILYTMPHDIPRVSTGRRGVPVGSRLKISRFFVLTKWNPWQFARGPMRSFGYNRGRPRTIIRGPLFTREKPRETRRDPCSSRGASRGVPRVSAVSPRAPSQDPRSLCGKPKDPMVVVLASRRILAKCHQHVSLLHQPCRRTTRTTRPVGHAGRIRRLKHGLQGSEYGLR